MCVCLLNASPRDTVSILIIAKRLRSPMTVIIIAVVPGCIVSSIAFLMISPRYAQ